MRSDHQGCLRESNTDERGVTPWLLHNLPQPELSGKVVALVSDQTDSLNA